MKTRLGAMFESQRWLGLILIFLWLSACRPTPAPEVSMPAAQWTAAITEPSRSTDIPPSAIPTNTMVFELGEMEDPVEDSGAAPLPNLPAPAPDPLRFTFPTPQAMPVSAWRPPLYPTPWALSPYDHFYFARPIAADQVNWPLQNYRYGGEFFQDVVHTGVDIPAPKGTPVLAAGSGKVVWSGYGVYRGGFDTTDPYGLAVTIKHDFGYQGEALFTIYGHLDQIDVVVGQFVQAGESIGLVGETGRVTGPHLHFEVRVGENNFFSTRNPELWIVPPVGWGVLAGQVRDSSGGFVEAQPLVLTSLSTGQNWFSRSYGAASPANPDPYYQENMVIGDLPAGKYLIRISYTGVSFSEEVEIFPGQVSYFYFYGKNGIVVGTPPTPAAFSIDEGAIP
jgi:murein DD-endopeptidase MepM/ murein hydrolase activator NlpD